MSESWRMSFSVSFAMRSRHHSQRAHRRLSACAVGRPQFAGFHASAPAPCRALRLPRGRQPHRTRDRRHGRPRHGRRDAAARRRLARRRALGRRARARAACEQRPGLELVEADLFEPDAVAAAVALAAGDAAAPLRRGREPRRRLSRRARASRRRRSRQFEAQLRLNLRPTYLVTQAALPHLVAAGGGVDRVRRQPRRAAAVRRRGRLRRRRRRR